MVADNGICNHDLTNEIEVLVKHLFLFPVAMFNMMKLLAILQVEAGKTIINGLNLSLKILNTKTPLKFKRVQFYSVLSRKRWERGVLVTSYPKSVIIRSYF